MLVVEGSLPLDMPEACMIGESTEEHLLLKPVPRAKAIVAADTCATFGGMPAAEGNQTGAAGVSQFMAKHNLPIQGRLINCPSCPVHPKCLIGTLAYVAAKGYPQVNPKLLTPLMFYGHSTHDECPRYPYYERKIFAKYLRDPQGCLFEPGCLGPISYTECPHRQWNTGVNRCIRASAPCIGCSSPHFGKRKDFRFYRKGERQHPVAYTEQDRKGGRP